MARWIPDRGIRIESPEVDQRRPAQFRKHSHYMSQLDKCSVSDIRSLDKPFTHGGKTTTLRKEIMSLTHPLVPPLHPVTGNPIILTEAGHIKMTRDGRRPATPEPLFHGVEMSQRFGQETICEFVSYKDRMSFASSVSRIMPAIVYLKFGVLPDLWFHKNAESVVPQVTFEIDEDTGEWTGNWTTRADEESHEMLLEELPGMEGVEFDLSAVMGQLNSETRPSMDIQDAASVGTSVNSEVFQAALGHAPPQGNANGQATTDNGENNNNNANANGNSNNNNEDAANGENGTDNPNDSSNTNNNNNNLNDDDVDDNGDNDGSDDATANSANNSNNTNGSRRVDSNQTQHSQEGVQQDEARTASPVGNVLGRHNEGVRPGP